MFKQIPFGNGNYYIDENGTIINTDTNKIKKQSLNNVGYRVIRLSNNGVSKLFLVHRLVAIVFLPNPNNLPVVRHMDNNPLNCHVSNLKWSTQRDNVQQAYDDGIGGGAHKHIYNVYLDNSPVYIEGIGAKEIANRVHATLYSIHYSIRTDSIIRQGPFKDWKIERVERPTIIR